MRGTPSGPAGSHQGVDGTAPGDRRAGASVPGGTPERRTPRALRDLVRIGMSKYSVSLIWIALPLRCMRMIRRFCAADARCQSIGSPAKNVG
jgi:hypothetical protein